MNTLKTTIIIAISLLLSMSAGCTSTSIQPPSISLSSVGLTTTPSSNLISNFVLSSPEVSEGGMLPAECTCDGISSTLPLEWTGAPVGTQSFALVMYTIPNPGESHWYWVLYNIPVDVTHLKKNLTGIGILGNNSVNGRTEYAPPCSKGPGPKLYTFTLFALSAPPQFTVPPAQVSRDVLLAAIEDRTLGSADLNVYYTRGK